jgi:beta-glucosidase
MCAYHCLGAKEKGIQVYIKHIGANEDDRGRNGAYKWLTEQALRENYLKPFEIAIKAGANGLMGSVTRTGGIRTTGSYALQTAVVRDEWGFRGTIITDYYQGGDINDFDEGIRTGNNQVLWPDWRPDCLDDQTSDTAKYYIHKAAKDLLYAYADTMYYAETAQGLESGAIIGTITVTDDVFVWWIPVLMVVNTIVVAAILSLLIPKASKAKKRRRDDDYDDYDDDDEDDFEGEISCGTRKYAVTVREID